MALVANVWLFEVNVCGVIFCGILANIDMSEAIAVINCGALCISHVDTSEGVKSSTIGIIGEGLS